MSATRRAARAKADQVCGVAVTDGIRQSWPDGRCASDVSSPARWITRLGRYICFGFN
jgi:hypothetical protein